ncbi:hypothetical protein [Dactylosporangium sp. CA-233914]|uniref:hypothetical protein n=1 Tax=Dactylosporangium sp. CA-233914 TaxID=3239934 RepID=UPI003D933189
MPLRAFRSPHIWATPGLEGGAHGTARSVADAVLTGTDQEKIRIVTMSPAEMATAMRDNAVYGAIVIPEDFDQTLAGLAAAVRSMSARPSCLRTP